MLRNKVVKTVLIGLLSLTILILITLGGVLGPYIVRVQHFPANPSEGYYADFYVYISPGARQATSQGQTATLLVQPNNSGTNSDDPTIHQRDAWWTGFGRHRLANQLDVILLVPAFIRPGEDWQIYTHALDRDVLTTDRTDLARLDLQLLAMVDVARTTLAADGIATGNKFLIQGYSASGMFANRFAALHPERVKAVAAGSPGGWPIAPVAEFEGVMLPYPIGIADLELLTGQPFDEEAFRRVPHLIVMGSLDGNDSLDFSDGWDPARAAVVDQIFGDDPLSRWEDAKALYGLAGVSAEFVLVEGVGHNRRQLQPYTTEFFREILAQ